MSSTTSLVLLAVLCVILAQVRMFGQSDRPAPAAGSGPQINGVSAKLIQEGRTLQITALSKSVEALEFYLVGTSPVHNMTVLLDRPVIAAGESKYWPTRGNTAVVLWSVAYSDGTSEGDGDGAATKLIKLRNQVAAGGPILTDAACNCGLPGTLILLMKSYRKLHPDAPAPTIVTAPATEDDPTPEDSTTY